VLADSFKDVDARDKPGHDEEEIYFGRDPTLPGGSA